MIYDMQALKTKYKNYSNINQKISIETKKNNLIRIKRGLYTDDLKVDGPVIANVCYGPSYLSFEYALSYYGLIPEYVSVYTSACFGKKNNKRYQLKNATFEYRSVPDKVFSYGITYLTNEKGVRYKIARKEKALCDTLYSKYPVRSIKDLKIMLFDDLRIDEDEFMELDFDFIILIAPLYRSNTLSVLRKYVLRIKRQK
ncbi:MAG TPA: hypothetical protein GX010_01660 [Erysipelotrichaceae bacterium]|nr:hypothetical protein [Erysipelotrichaceae bacterium]